MRLLQRWRVAYSPDGSLAAIKPGVRSSSRKCRSPFCCRRSPGANQGSWRYNLKFCVKYQYARVSSRKRSGHHNIHIFHGCCWPRQYTSCRSEKAAAPLFIQPRSGLLMRSWRRTNIIDHRFNEAKGRRPARRIPLLPHQQVQRVLFLARPQPPICVDFTRCAPFYTNQLVLFAACVLKRK